MALVSYFRRRFDQQRDLVMRTGQFRQRHSCPSNGSRTRSSKAQSKYPSNKVRDNVGVLADPKRPGTYQVDGVALSKPQYWPGRPGTSAR